MGTYICKICGGYVDLLSAVRHMAKCRPDAKSDVGVYYRREEVSENAKGNGTKTEEGSEGKRVEREER